MLETVNDRLDAIAESADYSIVGPHDSRVHETRTTTFPWNTLCHVERDFGDGRWRGCSGVLVAPRTVITAAHCLFNHMLRRAPRRVRVIPGRRDRDVRPYGIHPAASCWIPRGYLPPLRRIPSAREFDYGVIRLSRNVAGISRFMKLAAPTAERLNVVRQRKLITIAGYPGDRPIGTLWRHSERLTHVEPRRLRYTVDTCPGHSGSPIWYRTGAGDRHIIGVHTSGIIDEVGRSFGCAPGTVLAPAHLRNSGVRITPEVLVGLRDSGRATHGANAMQRVL